MNSEAAHTGLWKTSDTLFGGALLLGLALEYLMPLSIDRILTAHSRMMLGGVILSSGVLMAAFAKVQFARAKQPSAPDRPITCLVQSGIFKYTRNPLYLGLVVTLVGLGLIFDMPWWIILTGLVIGLVQ